MAHGQVLFNRYSAVTPLVTPLTTSIIPEIARVKDLFPFKVAISDFGQVNSQFDRWLDFCWLWLTLLTSQWPVQHWGPSLLPRLRVVVIRYADFRITTMGRRLKNIQNWDVDAQPQKKCTIALLMIDKAIKCCLYAAMRAVASSFELLYTLSLKSLCRCR